MARILAMDTSGGACSVALLHCDQSASVEVLHRHHQVARGHTDLLLPMVDELLSLADVRLSQLDALALGHGPGSFTGLRISAGVAQGLAFGAGLPVVSVSSLAAIARAALAQQPHGRKCRALVCIDARMGEVYFGAYHGGLGAGTGDSVREVEVIPLGAGDQLLTPDAIDLKSWLEPGVEHLLLGSGWGLVEPATSGEALPPFAAEVAAHAVDVAWLGLSAWRGGATLMPHQLEPVYLRDRVAWQKAKH